MKNLIIRAACNLGALGRAIFGPLSRCGPHILMYHRAAPVWPGAPAPTLNVPPQQLERQWVGLRKLGYEIVPLQTLVDTANAGLSARPRQVAITFDDGYENMYTQVLPLAERLQCPVTVFVSTEWVDNDTAMHFDAWGIEHQHHVPRECYRPLSWWQCAEMHASPWVEIAAHTHSHADFRGDLSRFRADMEQCLDTLQRRLGISNPNFAFPFGRVDEGFATPAMMEIVREMGVSSALTTEPGPALFDRSPLGWGRNHVFQWDTEATIDARLTNWYGWLPRLRRGLRQLMGIAKHPLYYETSDQPTTVSKNRVDGKGVLDRADVATDKNAERKLEEMRS